MDIAYSKEQNVFKYRVCAVMLHDQKILAMKDECSPYYYLPGGKVMFGETAENAIKRELREELKIEAKIVRPLCLNQSFFTEDVNGMRYHELTIYFLIEAEDVLLERGERFSIEEGKHLFDFEWLKIESLKNQYFYPLFLKETIDNLPESFTLRTEIED